MAVQRTLTIIKPDAVAGGVAGQIISRFEQAGLKILAAKLVQLTPAQSAAVAQRAVGWAQSIWTDILG